MAYKIARYGWVRDLPDQRDHLYAAPPAALTTLPPHADLRPGCPPVYDQGQIGSCTASSSRSRTHWQPLRRSPSRLFIYYKRARARGT